MNPDAPKPPYLSQLLLNPSSRDVLRDLKDPREMHRTLLRAFTPGPEPCSFRKEHSVLFRLEINQAGMPAVLVQSGSEPDWSFLSERRGYLLCPASHKEIGPLLTQIQTDKNLLFRLRANPTRKICTKTSPEGVHSNGKRVPFRKPEEQIDWLKRKAADGGFSLAHSPKCPDMPDVRIVQERDVRAVRSDPESPGRVMTFGGVLFEGRLVVKDTQLFRKTILNGIGSAKAFGFGLLSVAPVRGADCPVRREARQAD